MRELVISGGHKQFKEMSGVKSAKPPGSGKTTPRRLTAKPFGREDFDALVARVAALEAKQPKG